jgi:hypothetical protein
MINESPPKTPHKLKSRQGMPQMRCDKPGLVCRSWTKYCTTNVPNRWHSTRQGRKTDLDARFCLPSSASMRPCTRRNPSEASASCTGPIPNAAVRQHSVAHVERNTRKHKQGGQVRHGEEGGVGGNVQETKIDSMLNYITREARTREHANRLLPDDAYLCFMRVVGRSEFGQGCLGRANLFDDIGGFESQCASGTGRQSPTNQSIGGRSTSFDTTNSQSDRQTPSI